jgi:hypothetical protein
MGPKSDPEAVVDQSFRVHGVEGLRVVDASVMPNIVRANTNLTCIMLGERKSPLNIRSSAEPDSLARETTRSNRSSIAPLSSVLQRGEFHMIADTMPVFGTRESSKPSNGRHAGERHYPRKNTSSTSCRQDLRVL